MNQIFWYSYKRLEKEVLALSENVYIDDDQLRVNSPRICDLLVRTAIEIEALAKELYFANGGVQPEDRDLYFDTDCLKLLEDKWSLNKKQIFVVSPKFDFSKHENNVLQPLWNAAKRSKPRWKKAYQDVKHDRVRKLKQGKIEHLLKALGALYILNVYYQDIHFPQVASGSAHDIDWGLGSEIFAVKVSNEGDHPDLQVVYKKKSDYDESIYFVKRTDRTAGEYISVMQNVLQQANKIALEETNKCVEDMVVRGELPNDSIAIVKKIGEMLPYKRSDAFDGVMKKEFRKVRTAYVGLKYEAVLNKNQY